MAGEPSQDRLTDLLLRWDELRREGREVAPETLCADCPERADELGRMIEELRALDLLLDDEKDTDPTDEDDDSTWTSAPSRGGRPGPGPDAGGNGTVSTSLRYRRLRLLFRGGLGEVFVARDEQLNREVALKEIRGRMARDPASRDRFLAEAEVTGNLEHPGIVPVYGLGTYPDGRPFYAMRLIQGETLKEAIDRFHRALSSPGERVRALHGLLRRFLNVCDAIAYAHSRGVIHRDLKPSNVMLGKFGETMVVDWGLARCVGRTDAAEPFAEDPLGSLRFRLGAIHQLSAASGTPAFMSPEQTRGEAKQIGPASDIYSLGVTLYALLTGRVPFEGDSVAAIFRDVQQGHFPPPRSIRPEIPRGLEAICLKAMAREPEERYARVQDLSDDLDRWLADEPVSAYREPWATRLRRRLNRHRTLMASAAAIVVIVAISLAVTTLVLARANRRERTLRTIAQGERDRAGRAEVQAIGEARRAREEARKSRMLSGFLVRLFQSSDPLGLEGQGFREPSESIRDLTAVQLLRRGAERVKGLGKDQAADPATTATLMDSIGNSLRSVGDIEQARTLLSQALALRRASPRTDDSELAASLFHLGILEHDTGDVEAAQRHYREAIRLYQKMGGDDDASVTNVKFRLAWLLAEMRHIEDAEAMFREVLRDRQAQLGPNHPELQIVRLALLMVLLDRGDRMALMGQATDLLSQDDVMIRTMTTYLWAMTMRLANAYHAAAPLYEQVLAACRKHFPPQHPVLGLLLGDMAGLYRQIGDLRRAEELIREALAIGRRTIPLHPRMIEGLSNLADEMATQGRLDEAEGLYLEAIDVARRRGRAAGDDAIWRAIADRLIRAEHDRGRTDKEALYREMFSQR